MKKINPSSTAHHPSREAESPAVAVIGGGYWGKNLVRNFYNLDSLKLVSDKNETILSEYKDQYKGIETCLALADVLSNDDIRGVVIATPAETHFNIARESLFAGKHVFVEKPLVLRAEEGRELIDLVPLAGRITIPDRASGTLLPIHAGAAAFYDRHQPSFLQENAEPIALLVSVLVVLMSLLLHLNTQRRRKILEAYNKELLDLAQMARTAPSFHVIDECHTQLSRYVPRIVAAAGSGRINAHEFDLFSFAYEAVEDAIRDREHQLEREDLGAGRTASKRPSKAAKPKTLSSSLSRRAKPDKED